ncbi:MAG: hypothetical protein KBS98_02295, partial [Flavobacterium sp.]|nr:hypothetical protein [Candidatus Neoflavobacterium equi]
YAGATLGNNLFLIPINGFVELLIFSIFFLESSNYLPFYKNKYWMILVAACLALTVYEVIDIFTSTFENFKSSSRIIMTLFIVLFSVYYFVYNILKQKKIIKTNFYLYSGILLYFSMILVIFLPIDFLIHDETGLKYYFWFANNIISCIFYTFLIVSICTNGKTQQTLHKA